MSHSVSSLSPQTDRWLAPLAIALFLVQSSERPPESLLPAWEAIAAELWQRRSVPTFTGIETLPCRYLQPDRGLQPSWSEPRRLPELPLLWAIAQQQTRESEAIALELADLGRHYGTVILPLTWWQSLPQVRLRALGEQLAAWQTGYRWPPGTKT